MEFMALAAWSLAIVAGASPMTAWLGGGGLRGQPTKVTRYPAAVVLAHPVLAVLGLAAWVMYIATTRAVYGWSAFGALVVVTLLGFALFTRWLVGRGGRHARGGRRGGPPPMVAVHGTLAVTAFVLVFLSVFP